MLESKETRIGKENLIIAARDDGLGCRIMAILHAMYYAKKLEVGFGFVWEYLPSSVYGLSEKEMREKKADIKNIEIAPEEEIFSKDFIEKYSYTGLLKQNAGLLAGSKVPKNLKDLLGNEFAPNKIHFVSHNIPRRVLKNSSYKPNYAQLFREIDFSEKIKSLFKKVDEKITSLQGKFIAIHIRSGDIIYSEYSKLFGDIFKGVPLELALELIKTKLAENYRVVVFSDDRASLYALKQIFTKNFFIFEDFFEKKFLENLSLSELALLEMYFMSKSSQLYSSWSNFAILATSLQGKELQAYQELFDTQKTFDIVSQGLKKYNFSPQQRAFSFFYLFRLALLLNKPMDLCEKLLQKAFQSDENILYQIHLIDIYLKQGKMIQAENLLNKLLLKDKQLFEIAFWKNTTLNDLFLSYFSKNLTNFKNLSLLFERINNYKIQNNIKFKGGTSFVKNSYTYKLGQEFRSHPLSFILRAKDIPKEEIKIALEDFEDYNEAKKYTKHLNYTLGEALGKELKYYQAGGGVLSLLKIYYTALKTCFIWRKNAKKI